VTAPTKGRRDRPGIRVHTSRLPRQSTVVDGIPVTTVARTLLDLATVVDVQELRLAVEAAERRQVFDLREIEALRTHGHHGAAPLNAAIAAAFGDSPWTRSEFENQFLAFLRARGLPEPQTNVLVHGQLVDFYWPEHRLAVETDGYQWHRGFAAFENDRRRDGALTVAGIRTLRLTQRRLEREPGNVEGDLSVLLDLL
jgi:very-short-patch-repair endonuclease